MLGEEVLRLVFEEIHQLTVSSTLTPDQGMAGSSGHFNDVSRNPLDGGSLKWAISPARPYALFSCEVFLNPLDNGFWADG
jgi:hypothetical protein